MKTIKLLAFCLLASAVLSSCGSGSTPNPVMPKSQVDSVSYAVGAYLSSAIKEVGDINYDKLIQGIKDAVADKISQEELEQIMPTIQNFLTKRNTVIGDNNKAEGEEFLAENGKKEGVITTESGLQYQIVTAGNGVHPAVQDTIECNYVGTLLNGKEFDSSYKRNEPLIVPLERMIPGWKEGIPFVDEGGKIKLWIPSDLAYGDRAPAEIGQNATLVFEVELIKVRPGVAPETTPAEAE